MKTKIYYFGISILISLFLTSCYTQLDLVDRTEDTYYYYVETEEGDSVLVEERYNDYYYGYDPYYDFYWDPWYPRWGLFVGFYPWYSWRYHYFDPFGYWPYYGHYYGYYPYWYYSGNLYAHKRDFKRRTFNRRFPYRRTNNSNRIVARSSSKRLTTNSGRSLETKKRRIVVDSRRRIRTSIRKDRYNYPPLPVIRKSNGRSYYRSSSSRRPSFSGRSSSIRSSTRGSVSRSGRSSSSGRSTSSSSRRPSRR